MRKTIQKSSTLSPFDRLPLRRLIPVFCILFFLSACAPVSPTASQNRRLFEELCHATDRDFIKRKATSKGYAQASQISETIPCPSASLMPEVFTEMGYHYYECVIGPWLDGDNSDITTYRLSLETKGASACQAKNERTEKANKALTHWRQKYGGFETSCISVVEQNGPSSRYIKIDDHGRVLLDGTHEPGKKPSWRTIPGYISFSRARVVDRTTNEIIAERKFYFLLPHSANFIDFGHDQCESRKTWTITDVIIPAR